MFYSENECVSYSEDEYMCSILRTNVYPVLRMKYVITSNCITSLGMNNNE